MKKILLIVLAVFITTNLSAAYTYRSAHWSEYSVEKKGISYIVYNLAKTRFDALLAQKKGERTSAFLGQTKGFQDLPPAVVMDIDDTILDTTSYRVYLKNKKIDNSKKEWNEYVTHSEAPAVYGAVDFINYVKDKNVTIFLVSNRYTADHEGTYKNLRKVGVNFVNMRTQTLLNGDKKGWTSNKASRYAYIAKKYRIMMLVGDDFNDFIYVKKLNLPSYYRTFDKYKSHLGVDWFQLANPLDGSWNVVTQDTKLVSYNK